MSAMTDALHEAADLVAAHPELPEPYITSNSRGADVFWFLDLKHDQAAQRALVVAIRKALGGKWDKDPHEKFNFKQKRGPLSLLIQVEREAVCERVVTGTETVTVPAVEAQPERTEEREVVEWVCDEPILKAVGA